MGGGGRVAVMLWGVSVDLEVEWFNVLPGHTDGGWHVGFMGAFKVVCYCTDSHLEWDTGRHNIMFIFTTVGLTPVAFPSTLSPDSSYVKHTPRFHSSCSCAFNLLERSLFLSIYSTNVFRCRK